MSELTEMRNVVTDFGGRSAASPHRVVDLRHGARLADCDEAVPARSIVFVGTYPPTACGLATFTDNLRAAIAAPASGWTARVVRVLDREEPEESSDVIAHWVTGDAESLRHALHHIELFDAVVLQHEYGLFGGEDGADVLDLVSRLDVPLVLVLHTALQEPSPHQRYVLDRLLQAAAVVVVQSEAARDRILAVHDADPDHVVVVPHGAAENFAGTVLGDVSRPAVLTWGLLEPRQGHRARDRRPRRPRVAHPAGVLRHRWARRTRRFERSTARGIGGRCRRRPARSASPTVSASMPATATGTRCGSSCAASTWSCCRTSRGTR